MLSGDDRPTLPRKRSDSCPRPRVSDLHSRRPLPTDPRKLIRAGSTAFPKATSPCVRATLVRRVSPARVFSPASTFFGGIWRSGRRTGHPSKLQGTPCLIGERLSSANRARPSGFQRVLGLWCRFGLGGLPPNAPKKLAFLARSRCFFSRAARRLLHEARFRPKNRHP